MGKLKNLTIGKKLGLGFSLMILFMFLIGFAGYKSSKTIYKDLTDIFSLRLPSIDYLIEADRDLQQLLVAERSMIFAEPDSEVFRNLLADYEENFLQSQERWEKYKVLAVTPEEKEILPIFDTAREEWEKISGKVIDLRQSDTREDSRKALALTLTGASEKFEKMRDQLDRLTNINLELARANQEEANSTYRTMVISILVFTGLGLLFGVGLMWFVGGGTSKILKSVTEKLSRASEQVASGSEQISQSSQQLAEGSSQQAASIEETSSSLEEMSSMTRQNSDNAGMADNLMKEANHIVAESNESMKELTEAMKSISKASEDTFKIIKTIDEIAFQTNLLALNAAVEAARAGEAGAGFAVVADEVRNLAMRAAKAAKNTSDLIETTVKKINGGSELVTRTNEAFGQVTESSSKVSQLIGEIGQNKKNSVDTFFTCLFICCEWVENP